MRWRVWKMLLSALHTAGINVVKYFSWFAGHKNVLIGLNALVMVAAVGGKFSSIFSKMPKTTLIDVLHKWNHFLGKMFVQNFIIQNVISLHFKKGNLATFLKTFFLQCHKILRLSYPSPHLLSSSFNHRHFNVASPTRHSFPWQKFA